jgi:glycolate oxidase FAD binding subunit
VQAESDHLHRRLAEIVGSDHVTAGAARVGFTVDGVIPSLVIRPGSQEETAAVMATCAAAGAAVIPWGGGTSMGLGNPPSRADVALVLDRLNRIVEHDAPNLTVTAEAGVRLGDLQDALRERKQSLPLDPPAYRKATLGGILAANASGPARLMYGTARDWVLGMHIVQPDGKPMRCGGKVIKNVSGYDMNKLFIGSLGTLGIITEATFKLLPVPAVLSIVTGAFDEIRQVKSVIAKVLDSPLLPEALELLDPDAVAFLGSRLGIGATGYGLAVALPGNPLVVERQARDFAALFDEAEARETVTLSGERAVASWQALTSALDLVPGAPAERIICKIATPISRTADMLEAARHLGRSHRLQTVVLAHAGSGIVRACYLLGPDAPPAEILAGSIEDFRREAQRVEGRLILHEVPRTLKAHVDAWGKPGGDFDLMRRLKAEFDPRNLCNPGRFLGGL